MNKNNVAIAMFDNATAINVTFPVSGGKYTYMTLDKLEVGDKVLVDTPRAGLQVVEVTAVDVAWDIDAKFDYKFVVAKVDLAQYNKIQEALNEVREVIENERRAQARRAMTEQLGLKAGTVKKIQALTRL